MSTTRDLHGVVMDPERVVVAWCVRFAGKIISCSVKGANGFSVFQRAFQRLSHPRVMPSAWGEKILYLEATTKEVQITDKLLDGIVLCVKQYSGEFVSGTPGCVVCRTVKSRPPDDAQIQSFFFFSTAFVEHPGDVPDDDHVNPKNHESNR